LTGFFAFADNVDGCDCIKIWDTVAKGRRGRDEGNEGTRLGAILGGILPAGEASGEEMAGLGQHAVWADANAVIVTVAEIQAVRTV
jgi:hypothetical protein